MSCNKSHHHHCDKLTSNTLLFSETNTLLNILHIRLSFGIVHSIIIYSTISKITVRPREIGTGGTGVMHTSVRTLLNFDCLQVTISYQMSCRILHQSPSWGISRVHFKDRVSPTLSQVTPMQISVVQKQISTG